MYDFIYNLWFIYDECHKMGMGEKSQNTIKQKTKLRKRFSPFGCPTTILLPTKWRPTVFRCPKTPKTSQTHSRWERDSSLMGKKQQKTIQGWVRCGQLNDREYELYTCEIPRSSAKSGPEWGLRYENNGDGEVWQFSLDPPNTSTSSKSFLFLAGDHLVLPISHISS